jgi:hypothetical protein
MFSYPFHCKATKGSFLPFAAVARNAGHPNNPTKTKDVGNPDAFCAFCE